MISSSFRLAASKASVVRLNVAASLRCCHAETPFLRTAYRGFGAGNFSMDQLKDLRSRSGAPIVECKKALGESEGDVEKAMDWLRQHGAAKASSKVSGREATEGLVSCKVAPSGKMASLVMVSSETDFAGRSPAFVNLITHVTDATMASAMVGKIEDQASLKTLEFESKSIQTALEEAIVAIRENLGIKSAMRLEAGPSSILVGYVHGRVDGSSAGSAAALVEIAGVEGSSKEIMEAAGKKLAMHVVAANPEFLNPESVPSSVLEREKAILEGQVCLHNRNC
jgi:elongation factor Ts